jgi:hypothetical protein
MNMGLAVSENCTAPQKQEAIEARLGSATFELMRDHVQKLNYVRSTFPPFI